MSWYTIQTNFQLIYSAVSITEFGKMVMARGSLSQHFYIRTAAGNQSMSSAISRRQSLGTNSWSSIAPQLQNTENWISVADTDHMSIKIPGYGPLTSVRQMRFLSDHTAHNMYNKSKHSSWPWNDIQLAKSGFSDRVVEVAIANGQNVLENIKVKYRIAECRGVKVCSADECDFCDGLLKSKNSCKSHPMAELIHSDAKFSSCPVSFVFIQPVVMSDNRRWIGSFTAIDIELVADRIGNASLHNHPLPLYESSNNSSVRSRDFSVPGFVCSSIQNASSQNLNLTPSQLLRGTSQQQSPRLVSDAASYRTVERIQQKSRQRALGTGSTFDFLASFDKRRVDELYQQGKRLCDAEKQEFVKMLSIPYVRQLPNQTQFNESNGFLTMNPLQSSFFCTADFLSFDATFNENREYKVTLHVGTFCHALNCYVIIAKYRCKKDNYDMYQKALQEIVQTANKDATDLNFPHFSWANLSSIVVDWCHMQSKAIKEQILSEFPNGQEIIEQLMSGCAVHFARSADALSKRYVEKAEQRDTFVHIVKQIPNCSSKEAVLDAFNVLGGKVSTGTLTKHSNFALYTSPDITLSVSFKISHWLNWWLQPDRLKALNPNFRSKPVPLVIGPTDTNHLKSLNRVHKSGTQVLSLHRAMLDGYHKDLDIVLQYVNGLLAPDTNFHEHSHEQRLLARFQQRMHRKRRHSLTAVGELAAEIDPKQIRNPLATPGAPHDSASIEF